MTRYWTLKMAPIHLYYLSEIAQGDSYNTGEWQYLLCVEFYMVDSKSRPQVQLEQLQYQFNQLLTSQLKIKNAPNLARLACLRAYRAISRQYPYLLSVKASVEANPEFGIESAIMELNVEDLVIEEDNNGTS